MDKAKFADAITKSYAFPSSTIFLGAGVLDGELVRAVFGLFWSFATKTHYNFTSKNELF
jgi:hypothetical protein